MNECRCNTLLGDCDLHPRQWPGSSDTQRAPIIEVPNNVNQAQVLVTRMFESLQADVARNHEFVATMMGSLENRIMEQQHFGVMLAELRERQQLIMQKLEGKFLWLDARNEARLATLLERLERLDTMDLRATRRFDMQDKDLIALAKSAPKKRQPKCVRKVTKR